MSDDHGAHHRRCAPDDPVIGIIWWLLGCALIEWWEPKFMRWYWHHIGGEGEPPKKWNDRSST